MDAESTAASHHGSRHSDDEKSLNSPADELSQLRHKYSHSLDYVLWHQCYREFVRAALNAGARSTKHLRQLVPRRLGPLEVDFLTIANTLDHSRKAYTNLMVAYLDPKCAACCREELRRSILAEDDLPGVVAFLRECTGEILLRKDWSWETLRDDRRLVALYSRGRRSRVARRGALRMLWKFWVAGRSLYPCARYLEDVRASQRNQSEKGKRELQAQLD